MTATCSATECTKTAHARGLCGTHYRRLSRTGSVDLAPYVNPGCSAPDCDRDAYSNGLCTTHYQRMRTHGRLELDQPTLQQRFDGLYLPDEHGCWIWQNRAGLNGYGRISVNDQLQYAHRVSWELHRGPIPDGLTIDHLCMVRLCVNPDHLEPVTLAENTRREMAARRAS